MGSFFKFMYYQTIQFAFYQKYQFKERYNWKLQMLFYVSQNFLCIINVFLWIVTNFIRCFLWLLNIFDLLLNIKTYGQRPTIYQKFIFQRTISIHMFIREIRRNVFVVLLIIFSTSQNYSSSIHLTIMLWPYLSPSPLKEINTRHNNSYATHNIPTNSHATKFWVTELLPAPRSLWYCRETILYIEKL